MQGLKTSTRCCFNVCFMIIIFASSASTAYASLNCDQLISSCVRQCCIDGECNDGTYSGQVCGCKNGDHRIDTSAYHEDARAYLTSLGYSRTWMESSYSNTDYTFALGSGQCRYQAIVSDDNHYVRYKDGPEPNPQPSYFSNGNPDLWNPLNCVRRAIENWHNEC